MGRSALHSLQCQSVAYTVITDLARAEHAYLHARLDQGGQQH